MHLFRRIHFPNEDYLLLQCDIFHVANVFKHEFLKFFADKQLIKFLIISIVELLASSFIKLLTSSLIQLSISSFIFKLNNNSSDSIFLFQFSIGCFIKLSIDSFLKFLNSKPIKFSVWNWICATSSWSRQLLLLGQCLCNYNSLVIGECIA